jgi:hypothetical protein
VAVHRRLVECLLMAPNVTQHEMCAHLREQIVCGLSTLEHLMACGQGAGEIPLEASHEGGAVEGATARGWGDALVGQGERTLAPVPTFPQMTAKGPVVSECPRQIEGALRLTQLQPPGEGGAHVVSLFVKASEPAILKSPHTEIRLSALSKVVKIGGVLVANAVMLVVLSQSFQAKDADRLQHSEDGLTVPLDASHQAVIDQASQARHQLISLAPFRCRHGQRRLQGEAANKH